MIKIWAEWDIGNEHVLFASKEAALKWCEENIHLIEIMETEEADLDELFDLGLLNFETLDVIT